MTLAEILKDSNYKLTQFNLVEIHNIEERIFTKQDAKGNYVPYINCLVRNKEIKLTPEEIVRQLFINILIVEYGYPTNRMQLEYPVKTGSGSKRADIVIFDIDRPTQPYIIVELKEPNRLDGKKQLESYCKFEGAPVGVWTNGNAIECYLKSENPKSKTTYLESLSYLPKANQTLSEVINVPYTIKNLILNDKLKEKSLKDTIREFEDVVLAHSGVDSFEEIFKLIFTKLFDEFKSSQDLDEIAALSNHGIVIEKINDSKFRQLEFRNTGTETEVRNRLQNLFDQAKKKWNGIFNENETFLLSPANIKTCVSYLQDIKLFNSNLEVVDDAFEYLVNKEQKGDKGQYFTPRYVIDMCIKMLNPKPHETMIDTAAGSCGFPMHTIFHVWKQLNPDIPHLFTTQKRTLQEIEYVQNKVFAIDFDLKSVRVGRTLNLIAGDGQTNVLLLNTLDYKRWGDYISDRAWLNNYNTGFSKLEKLKVHNNSYKEFNFDVLMANPPFAGDVSDEQIITSYELGKNAAGKYQTKVSRDILFIERNLDFLKPGGRMAIVLPQGRFNNSSDKQIREFIAERCRILAVVGLHGNVFKPHTGTKTSVLLVQKWTPEMKEQCRKMYGTTPSPLGRDGEGLDYPIFFATMQEPSKDNSGDKIYLRKKDLPRYYKVKPAAPDYKQADIDFVEEPDVEYVNSQKDLDQIVFDKHHHMIVKHDLYNHDGYTQDGIAEAFAEFAKKEQLSFF